jgi:murein L,D-transpeptidase YcbB/YkuD
MHNSKLPPLLTRRTSFAIGAAALVSGCHPWRLGRQVGKSISDPLARRFYAHMGWRAAWSDAQAGSLARITGSAAAHGLDPKAFAPKAAPGLVNDEALTLSALAYAKALASGFINPKTIEPIFTLKRNAVDLADGLASALDGGDLAAWFASLPPQDAEYNALSKTYQAALSQTGLSAPPARGAPVGQSMAPIDQARQLAANLERRRWLHRVTPDHRIDVNTAGAFLGYFINGRQVVTARTVVGRPDNPTPAIEAAFQRLIVNPPWRVPDNIAEKEILPKGEAYMAAQDMRIENGKVVQQPGAKSALGQVKFDVQDPYDIYLHDTPAKALFVQVERHRSHGCVRVQNAIDFARRIAAETGKAGDFDRALATTDTTAVELGQTIPVRLLYHTAYQDQTGQVFLDEDVYGTDDRLATALGLRQAVQRGRQSSTATTDYGP